MGPSRGSKGPIIAKNEQILTFLHYSSLIHCWTAPVYCLLDGWLIDWLNDWLLDWFICHISYLNYHTSYIIIYLTGCPINLVKFLREHPKTISNWSFSLKKGSNMEVCYLWILIIPRAARIHEMRSVLGGKGSFVDVLKKMALVQKGKRQCPWDHFSGFFSMP